nr:M55 family metallopeptidase [Actinopolymorpha pittospori]
MNSGQETERKRWPVKVYLSCGMEGVAGVVDSKQCSGPGAEYDQARELLLGEVNAAIEGALAGGATSIVVNDAHGDMNNLDPARLAGEATYISGRGKPHSIMEGLTEDVGVVFFVAYHGSAVSPGVLAHTYNPDAIDEVRVMGRVSGEAGINTIVAAAHDIPVGLATGDQYVHSEFLPLCPAAEYVEVKRSITRTSAENLHPTVARNQIRAAAERAVLNTLRGRPWPRTITEPADLSVELRTRDLAERALKAVAIPAQLSIKSVRVRAPRMDVFQAFLDIVAETRRVD